MTKEQDYTINHEIRIIGPKHLKEHQIRQNLQIKEKNFLKEQKPNELKDHTQHPYVSLQKETN